MKRIVLRLFILSGVVALGYFGFQQFQRFEQASHDQEPGKLSADALRDGAAKPIPLPAQAADSQDPASPAAADPFHAPRRDNGLRGQYASTAQDNDARDDENAYRQADDAGQRSDNPRDPRGADPFGLPTSKNPATGRYAERVAATEPTAADPDDDSADDGTGASSSEPRRLQPIDDDQSDRNVTATTAVADPKGRQLSGAPSTSGDFDPPADDSAFRSTDDNFAPPAGQERAASNEGKGKPGDQQLEGSQIPALTIEKKAPPEIQVGKPATFVTKVRNTGSVAAQGVEIHDEIPQGTQLVTTTPLAKRGPDGELTWDVGTMKPGEEVQVQTQLLPVSEGEIGSVATVHFRASASARSKATRPQLALAVTGPAKVMIGENVLLKVKVSNSGTGAATGVVIREDIPAGLKHAAGGELEFEIGLLKPGETRDLELTLTAAKAGPVTNVMSAAADANQAVESRVELEVVAPALKVGMSGPKRRYLERSAVYSISVSNPGTAPARDIELVTVLPKGLKFVEADNAGHYDAATRSVFWSLEELPAQETGTVTLTTLPTESGEQKLVIKSQAKQGLSDQQEESIQVDGLAAISFELTDVNDPIEVNGETTYEVRVTNQGSKAAVNVRVVALLPDEMKPVSADGPAKYTIDGQRVLFEPLSQLAPKADTTYSFKAQGLQAGDLRVRVQVMSDDMRTPLTKEESTRVYSDE